MRGALVDLEDSALDELRLELARVLVRNDLIVIALNDQRRDVELREILILVRLGECLDALVDGRQAAQLAREPEVFVDAVRNLDAMVRAVKHGAQIFPEL